MRTKEVLNHPSGDQTQPKKVSRTATVHIYDNPKDVPKDVLTEIAYDWMFFGFASYWAPVGSDSSSRSTVLLCFDLSDEKGKVETSTMEHIAEALKQRENNANRLQHSPFGIYVLMMEPLLSFFDQSLWGFRDPVRQVEKVSRISTRTNW